MEKCKMIYRFAHLKSFLPISFIPIILATPHHAISLDQYTGFPSTLWMMKANSLYFARMPPQAAFLLLFALALLLTLTQSVPGPCVTPYIYDYGTECFKQCPWNNTLITYLSPTNSSCIATCPNGTFADDSSKTCTTTCPSGPIRTYYDTKYHRCVDNCSSDFMQFAAPNYTCVTNCPSPTYGDELTGVCLIDCPEGTFFMAYNLIRLCVDVCYPDYYANLYRVCVAATSCPSYPATYFGDDSTGMCVKNCPVSKGTFADNSTRKCVIYCPLGTFADPVTQTCVNRCPAVPNLFGSNFTRNCIQLCNWGEYADPISRQCTRICPSGSYGDSSTRKCVKTCPPSQDTFADPLTNLCVKICPVDYYADTNTRYCVHGIDCSNNTYGDPVTQYCVEAKLCSLALFVDANLGLCVLRCSSWGNPETGFCQADCSIEYFKDPSTNLCVETCPINPSTFGDPLSRTCLGLCPVGYLADPSTLLCVETCPQSFFANDAVRQCVANCTQNSTKILFFNKPTLSCIAKCPLDYFADNATLTCTTVCSGDTFGYSPTRVCLQACPDGWFADKYTSQCVQSCPIITGQYADPSTHYCVDVCPSNPDYYGQDLNDGNLTCVPACTISGFFADPLTRNCLYKCNQTAGYFGDPSDGRCYSRCPTGYGNPLNAQCVPICPRIPKFFYGDDLTGLCVLSCPSETYGDPNNNLCVSALTCTAGLFGDDIAGLCLATCSELLGLYADPVIGKCVPVCTWPLYADPTDQTCTAACKSNYFKDNSTLSCVSTCSALPDTYGDPNNGFCQYNCTNGWFGYAAGSLRICLAVCPDNPPMLADLQNGICVHKCANQTYEFSNNTFRGCLHVCPPQVFNGSLQIDLFADNTTWKCVDVCPYGFYAFKHPSNSNIRECVRMCPMVGSTYYYAEDSTRMCVNDCPLLYQETYADKIDFRCTKVCSRGQFKDNSTATCVYRCPDNTYANNVTWNCSAWCDQGYFAENINNTCVKSCPKDLFGYQKVCIPQCPNNTMQYNDNSTWLCVQRCPSYPAYFADNSSVICVLSCPTGTYADQGTRQCVLPINCTEPTIADPATGRCVFQCPKEPMLFLTIQLNLCGHTCSNGTFAYNQTNLCVDQCPEPYWGVNITTDQFYCVQFCPQSYYMWVNITVRRCIPDCPDGLFRDNLTWSCVEDCPDYTYANESNNMCIPSCTPFYADDYSKTCVDICPSGSTASNHSYKCQSYCDYAEYNLDKVCVSACPTGLFADNLTRACLQTCPYDPLTFADPITKTCVIKCNASEYAFLSNLTCATTCPLGYYKELTLFLCLDKCLEGFFSDNDTQTCVTSCSLSSFPYADSTSQACLKTCPSDPDLYGYANKCITQCPLGFFAENFTRTCVAICPNISTTYPNASWADDLTRRCLARCSSLSYSFTNSTLNVCLNVCPSFFYASITEQACLEHCPPNTYALNSSTTCVDQCPPGLWADLSLRICMPSCSHNASLYADDSSSSCVEICPTYPDLFADKVAHKCLLTCPQGTFADDNSRTCLTNCLPPLFGGSYLLQCVSICLIPQLSFADSVLRTCVGNCVNHTINGSLVLFYEDNSTLSCVKQCPQTPNKLYGDNSTNTCVQTCPEGSFGDNDTRVCLDKCVFQTPKFTWKDNLNNFCVTVCPYGYFADNFTGSCQLTCANGTFADPSLRRCVVNCPINPASYSTVISGVGVCVYNCPDGTYSSQVSISCVSTCPTAPTVYYTYPPTNACVKQCLYPFYADLALQACVDSCKVGFYGNKTLKSCQACQVECVTCSGYLVCTSCIAGFYLYQITCVVQCPSYPVLYYANKQSGICNQSCSYPFFGQPSTGLCQQTCAALQYPNALTRVCTACPIGCQLCNAIGCSSCLVGFTFLPSAKTCNQNCNATAKYYFNDTCWTKCPAGSYLSYDLIHCLACSRPCATCVGAAGNCTSCIGSYFYLGQCKDACPNNFYIDDKLNCVACSSNPKKCALPPLTYKISTFTANFRVKAYVVFSRAVTMTTEQFMSTVQIMLNNAPIKANKFTSTVHNSTTYLVTFSAEISLNQLSLSFYFPPGSISDQFGNTLTTVTVNQNVSVVVSVNAQVAKTSESIGSMASYLSLAILALIFLLLLKSSYVGLVSLQAMQLIHLHLFLYWKPIPYMHYAFLDTMKYFNFMFIPSFFSPIGVIDQHLATVLPEASFLKNSPLLLMFAVGLGTYLVVSIISNKNFVSNKSLKKLFKRIRKYRVKYGLLLDICWAVYPFAMFISLKQFKLSSIGTTTATLNIALSGLTILILNAIVAYTVFLAYKYNKNQQKLPKKFAFLMLQPSNMMLDMPVRFLRKFLFVIALLLPSMQSQLILLLSVNISFLIMLACYRPSKSPLTHYASLLLQFLMILLQGLCFGYDKLINKSINNQTGFAIALITVQVAAMLIVLVWVTYRLGLNIKDSDVWVKIYAKLTANTDPEYLKEQQRKRDLQFDFEGLDAPSQDERTDHAMEKMTGKAPSEIGEKFNIFDQDREEGSFNLEKPFKVNESVKRPTSMDSSEKMAIDSRSSDSKGFFQANRTSKGRRRNHLQIRNNEHDHSVEEVMIISEENQSVADIMPKKQEKDKPKGVLWEDIDLDDDEY